MILDSHIHYNGDFSTKNTFKESLKSAGVDGGIIISEVPAVFKHEKPKAGDAKRRIDEILRFVEGIDNFYTHFWLDPLEDDALDQVDMALEAGITGIKVICGNFYPQDDRPMKVWAHIAKRNLPLLLHSGILYNSAPSAQYNRPGNFEDLIFIDNLKFALAHISWPWCDELVAVFGKWNCFVYELDGKVSSTMYIDLSPGTPRYYRERALETLLSVYPTVTDHMLFGSDVNNTYDSERVRDLIDYDTSIYDKNSLDEETKNKIFSKNLINFLGLQK